VKVGCSSANGNRKRITSAWLSRSVDHMVGPWRIDCVMERGSFAYEAFSKKPLLAETNDVRRRAQVGTEVQTAPLWSRFRLHLFILISICMRCPHTVDLLGFLRQLEEINAKSFASAKLIRILWL